MNVEKKLAKFSISSGVFFRKWSIDQSEYEIRNIGGIDIAFLEPKNNTVEAGVSIALKY